MWLSPWIKTTDRPHTTGHRALGTLGTLGWSEYLRPEERRHYHSQLEVDWECFVVCLNDEDKIDVTNSSYHCWDSAVIYY